MASIPAYIDYSKNVLQPQMDPDVLKEILGYEAAGISRTRATWSC
jgi:proline iminopeptidase